MAEEGGEQLVCRWGDLQDDLECCLWLLLGGYMYSKLEVEGQAAKLRELHALNGGDAAALDALVAPWLRRSLPLNLDYPYARLHQSPGSPLREVLRELASWQPVAAGCLLLLAAREYRVELAELLLRCGAPANCRSSTGWWVDCALCALWCRLCAERFWPACGLLRAPAALRLAGAA